jgi:hypothetical protein
LVAKAGRAATNSVPIIPVSSVSTASKETVTPPVAKLGVEALPSKAVLVVPLEKLPEIAAALSKQGYDGLMKKQVSLASNVPVKKHLQVQNESSAASSKPSPVPHNASGAPEAFSVAHGMPSLLVGASQANASGQKQLNVIGKRSNGSSSPMSGTIAQSTNPSVPEVLAMPSKVRQPDLVSTPNGSRGVPGNRSVPSLVSSVTKHQIVKAATPLSPLRGQSAANLALRAQVKPAVKKTGLVIKGVEAKHAVSDSTKATKVSTQTSGFDGFLSKFIS